MTFINLAVLQTGELEETYTDIILNFGRITRFKFLIRRIYILNIILTVHVYITSKNYTNTCTVY
jgi:hypothetical protein